MVIKGGSRSGAGNLAGHLLRIDTNERVEVRELRGVTATTLPGALQEMAALAAGTRCTRPLYHASLNPGPGETLTAAQQRHAIAALERRLGLEGHPRAVVEHRKAGRDHLHVVWSRIDTATMRAVHDGWNYRAHEAVARQLERAFGHRRIQGAHAEREMPGRVRSPRPARTLPAADVQQATRTGTEPAAVTAEVTRLWHAADSGKAFVAALQAAGYILAQGDRRGFCIVDPAGGVHSLARRLEDVRSKEVNARLAGIDVAGLPTVHQARAQQRQGQIPSAPVFKTPAPPPQGAATGAARPSAATEATIKLPTIHAPLTRPAGRAGPRRPDQVVAVRQTGREAIGREARYSPGIHPAASARSGPASATGRLLSGLFAAGIGRRAGARVRLGTPAPVPIGRDGMTDRLAFIPGGRRLRVARTPPKGGLAAERPFARLLRPALSVPQEVIAWAMEAKRKLIAYSDATGEYVAPELEHLSRIISGAYLDQGLTVTGKQRQTGPPSPS